MNRLKLLVAFLGVVVFVQLTALEPLNAGGDNPSLEFDLFYSQNTVNLAGKVSVSQTTSSRENLIKAVINYYD